MENATLISRIDIATGLFIIRVRPDRGVPDFVPGQYVAIGVLDPDHGEGEGARPKILKRAYSVASSPDEKGYLEFYIALVTDGILTPNLNKLVEGDRLFVSPKIVGTFTLDEISTEKHVVLVATGTGVAPFVSMLRTARYRERGNSFTVLHGVRYESALAYREEFERLAREHQHIKYFCTVSRAGDGWTGDRGYVGKFFREGRIHFRPEDSHVFLCGNPAMIDELEAFLLEHGFTVHSKKAAGNIHHEKYW